MKPVWIIDDDRSIRWVLEKALAREEIEYKSFASADEALNELTVSLPQIVISDIRMPGSTGLDLLQTLRRKHPALPVIIMTAYSDLESAVSSFQGGAFEYLPKPFDVNHAVELIRRALAQSQRKQSNSNENTDAPDILGHAPAMQEVFRAIGRLAQSNATVLINGESGTGKELVAQALHRHSARANKPFVAINTAAIPKDLLESELFGHEKGAFTGATTTRHGRFEQAEGGTLFLDEIGDMPLSMQVKLLRVIQERRVTRVGGDKSIPVNLHLLSASHQDLKKLVTQGRFREDLYYRLNVIQIQIPPLRQRREDILWLARRFLAEVAPDKRFGDEAEQALLTHDWPGNVRELRHAVERGSILTPGLKVGILALFDGETDSDSDSNESLPLSDFVAQSERRYILKILDNYAGHLGRTAEALGISRKNLWEKMKKLGLSRNEGDAQ